MNILIYIVIYIVSAVVDFYLIKYFFFKEEENDNRGWTVINFCPGINTIALIILPLQLLNRKFFSDDFANKFYKNNDTHSKQFR
jgi:hypothetical protein